MTSAPLSGRVYHERFSRARWLKEKIQDRGGREQKWGRGKPREEISGKIIAKFEYDSPRGYEPVEDIPEILQASFVRGLPSPLAVFSSLSDPGSFHSRSLSFFRGLSASPSTHRRFGPVLRG